MRQPRVSFSIVPKQGYDDCPTQVHAPGGHSRKSKTATRLAKFAATRALSLAWLITETVRQFFDRVQAVDMRAEDILQTRDSNKD